MFPATEGAPSPLVAVAVITPLICGRLRYSGGAGARALTRVADSATTPATIDAIPLTAIPCCQTGLRGSCISLLPIRPSSPLRIGVSTNR